MPALLDQGNPKDVGGRVRSGAALTLTVLVALLVQTTRTAHAAPARAKAPEDARADQLAEACESLRDAAVKGPYGWGWTSDAVAPFDDTRGTARAKQRQPDIDTRVTAAAGLVLQLASQELRSEANADAALQAARAIAAVQLPTGQVPPRGRLVPKPAGHPENAGLVPDRRPTCAALGLLLLVIDANREKPDPRVMTAATRAATWLARQQTSAGGWQSAWPPGPGVTARRIIRLDDGGYRDSTLALLLASRVLKRQEYALAADRSVEQLLKLRIHADGSPGVGLWGGAHTLGGEPLTDVPELPLDIDLLATQHAMETLLVSQFLSPKPALSKELAAAAQAAGGLPMENGRWQRRYDLYLRKPAPAAPSEEAKDTSEEAKTEEKIDEGREAPDKALAPPDRFDETAYIALLRTVNLSLARGPGAEWAKVPVEMRLARTVSGLSSDPLTLRATQSESMPVLIRAAVDTLSPIATEPKR